MDMMFTERAKYQVLIYSKVRYIPTGTCHIKSFIETRIMPLEC